jgi:hypothetical protein
MPHNEPQRRDAADAASRLRPVDPDHMAAAAAVLDADRKHIDGLVEAGVVFPPGKPKGPPPVPIACAGGLSDLVLAQRA